MKATELRNICSFSQTRKNMLDYYRTSEIAQNGSGDENITIIQSPGIEYNITYNNYVTVYVYNNSVIHMSSFYEFNNFKLKNKKNKK